MTTPQRNNLIGSTAVDASGERVGRIGQVYLDDATGQPEWVTVRTGLLGLRESFAPLYGARADNGELRLAVTKQQVKDAPSIDDDGSLAESELEALYLHYAGYLGPSAQGVPGSAGMAYAGTTGTGAPGRDVSGQTTDDAMTRSEERLHVGTEAVPAGRARLRKYVVTENVTQTVPVSHEEVRVEREPITEANVDAAVSGPDISEEEHEVTLRAERPVVAKEAVPVERVRLATETVTEEHEVNEQIRKERIEEPDIDPGAPGSGR